MQGLKQLLDLPDEIKEQIINDFGSVGNLYRKVFDLNQEEYKLTGNNSPRIAEIQNELYDIEEKLESYGVTDGRDITTDISSDFGDIIVSKRIDDLNRFLQPLGTDFETMQIWLKENYGI
jgi:hypothetical protein